MALTKEKAKTKAPPASAKKDGNKTTAESSSVPTASTSAAKSKSAGDSKGKAPGSRHSTGKAPAIIPPMAFVPPHSDNEHSLTRLIELYGEQSDLLRIVLSAKSEQDRARAEYERRVQEELRYETRRLEFEMMLHHNYFKQQDREHEEKRHLLMPTPKGPMTAHRSDVVLHSPLPPSHPLQQQQQQQQQQQHSIAYHPEAPMVPVGYGVATPSHDPYNMRSYHHPDTPGGLDAHMSANPFAFFKQPLGPPIHHPSAYPTPTAEHHMQQQQLPPTPSHDSLASRPLAPGATASARLGIRDRRAVPPAVSGLSVRISASNGVSSDSPRSAPVDGPNPLKRKISHDEVIMALRRKVMSKGNPLYQHRPGQQQQKRGAGSFAKPQVPEPAKAKAKDAESSQPARGSALAISTDVSAAAALGSSSSSDDESDDEADADDEGAAASNEQSPDAVKKPAEKAAEKAATKNAAVKAHTRLPSISVITEGVEAAAGNGQEED